MHKLGQASIRVAYGNSVFILFSLFISSGGRVKGKAQAYPFYYTAKQNTHTLSKQFFAPEKGVLTVPKGKIISSLTTTPIYVSSAIFHSRGVDRGVYSYPALLAVVVDMTVNPHIPTTSGRSTSDFHRPRRPCSQQARSAVRCWAAVILQQTFRPVVYSDRQFPTGPHLPDHHTVHVHINVTRRE